MLVEAYSTTTGKKRMVPEHWLTTDSPAIQGRFSKTPRQKVAEQLEGPPTEKWTIAQLTRFAADHGIDLGEAKLHADIFAAVNAHQPDAGNN